MALTFKVAAADLTSTGKITLEDMDLPVRGLSFTSDKIQVCASPADIGNQVDPEGSAAEANKMKPADAATVKKVRNAVNGYYFEFYVTVGTMVEKYKLEFSAPNKFVLDTAYLDNSGTYEVYNGYVVLNYKTSNTPLYIAYDFNSGDISMYCADAFSIAEQPTR